MACRSATCARDSLQAAVEAPGSLSSLCFTVDSFAAGERQIERERHRSSTSDSDRIFGVLILDYWRTCGEQSCEVILLNDTLFLLLILRGSGCEV